MAEPWIESCADQLQGTKWSAASIIACIESYHAPCALMSKCAAERVRDLEAEVARLKRGDFTPEEFQALCHHRDEKPGCTRAEFEVGCREYQERLFG